MTERRHYSGTERAFDAGQARHEDCGYTRDPLLVCIQALLTTLAVLLLLFSLSAHGESYSFRAYQRPDGLDNLNIHDLIQDRDGRIWLGTENGLFRFDGARAVRVPSFEDHDLPFIQALAQDGAGRIWIANDHELIYLDAAGRVHDPALPRFGQHEAAPNAIAVLPSDRDGIYFLADRQVFHVRSSDGGLTWQESPLFAAQFAQAQPELKTVQSLYAAPAIAAEAQPGTALRPGSLWIGCDRQICAATPDGTALRRWGPEQGVPADTWSSLFCDRRGRLWARGVEHLISLAPGASRFVSEEHNLTAKSLDMRSPSLAEDPQGRMLTNLTGGIGRLEGGHWRVFGHANNLPEGLASNLTFDRQGSLWFAAAGHGLARWIGYGDWEMWTEHDGLGTGNVWGLSQDRLGRVWVASELDLMQVPSGEAGAEDRRAIQQASGHPMRQTQAVAVDPQGRVWAGDGAGNVKVYDPIAHSVRLAASQLAMVYALSLDPDGTLWVCARKGLYRFDPKDGYRALSNAVGGSAMPGGGFYQARLVDGIHYFLGERGLFTLSPRGVFTQVKIPPEAAYVLDGPLAVAPDGTVWLQGQATALVHLRVRGAEAQLIERVGAPQVASPSVYQISFDRRGWMWVGTDAGMDIFNGRQWTGLTEDDGLVWDDTDSNSFLAPADGSVWIGTSGGLAHLLHPETVFERQPLRVDPIDVRLGETPLSLGGESSVAWKQRGALTLRLAVSNPARASVVRYRYRMEGLENGWQDTDERLIRYSALPPGLYRLAIMAVDTRRHQESAPVYIQFRLLPPWWRTAWFLCGLAVTLACLVGLGSWWRVSSLIAQQQRLEELVRERTQQLEMEKKELIEARLALVEQSSRDGLTGLLNRSAIFDVLTNEINYANDKRTPLAIVLADLDHFKRINDTYGHQVGDAVLRECARRFRQATRPTDYVGRYGGEELLLVMPGLSPENSTERLQYLRASIAHEMFDCDGIGLPVTCSFGVAWLDDRVRSIKPLVALADQALYAAKTRGRNRVETMFTSSSGLFFPDGSGPLAATR